jgi:hypothetical protein
MMVALPYWRDCLKFSAGGKVDQMRKAHGHFEAQLCQRRPDIESVRQELYRGLGLGAPASPLEALHRAVTEGATTKVVAPSDGNPFQSLFNEFVVPDNPLLAAPGQGP